MSYTPVLNDILEARYITFAAGPPSQVGINRLRFRVTSITGAGVTDIQIAQQLDANASAPYKALLGNLASYRGVMLQKIYPTPRTFRAVGNANAGIGTAGASMAPTQVSGLIKANTARAGRAFRGRMYVPFASAADVTAVGNVSAGYLTNLLALIATTFSAVGVVVGVNATTLVPVIFHPKGYGIPPAGVNTSDPITDATASTLWATERRRGNYGRSNSVPPI